MYIIYYTMLSKNKILSYYCDFMDTDSNLFIIPWDGEPPK